jgi:predicted enzyme related to lactoylglutathione lyase
VSDAQKQAPGTVIGFDLTVPDAEAIRDFYASVVGWRPEPFDMGGYADYFMKTPAEGQVVAGVCHTRGENADMPPQWLTYVVVDDLDASLERCQDGGGRIVTAIKGNEGEGRYCVIQDPAGAYLALMQTGG